ncbi:MAG: arginase family protein [Ignavibacteriaceae bacterium]
MQVIFTPYFLEKYKEEYHSVKREGWYENLYKGDSQDPHQIITALNNQVADFVEENIHHNKLPVCIGGDCFKPFGVLKGLLNSGKNPSLLWLDAHGDFNTRETSQSGFFGGMPLAILTGRDNSEFLKLNGLSPLPDEKVILYDRRDLDTGEVVLLAKSKVRQPENMSELIEMSMGEKQIYLHLDTDIINPVDAPAMLFKTPGGPSLAEIKTFIETIKEKIAAVSVTLWEPSLDTNQQTAKAVFELLQLLD